jgi:hypothetical protein
LETSLEREGAGGGLKPLLKEQGGVGVDGDPRGLPRILSRKMYDVRRMMMV